MKTITSGSVNISPACFRERLADSGMTEDDMWELLLSATSFDASRLQHHLQKLVLECQEPA